MDPARRWKQIQAKIDFCWDCLCIGGDLLAPRNQNPARPPYIGERPVLFLSEAPPPSGGFWAPYPVQDDLRENLFGILRAFGVYLPKDDHARETLDAFRAMGLFLVQTVKWPLQDSARAFDLPSANLLNTRSEHIWFRSYKCCVRWLSSASGRSHLTLAASVFLSPNSDSSRPPASNLFGANALMLKCHRVFRLIFIPQNFL